MQKYKLINTKTKEEYICDKVIIDEFDYYVSEEKSLSNNGDWYLGYPDYNTLFKWSMLGMHEGKQVWINKIIATNNPNIDVPIVVDWVELRDMLFVLDGQKVYTAYINDHNSEIALSGFFRGCKHGYNKAKEQFGNSDEDMIEFVKWKYQERFEWNIKYKNWTSQLVKYSGCVYTTQELLQLWKEQQVKIVYYE